LALHGNARGRFYTEEYGQKRALCSDTGNLYAARNPRHERAQRPALARQSEPEEQVRVRQPETNHEVWNSCLSARLARIAKSPKEQVLKVRLRELVRG
jgi:hypothetical protein